MGDYDMIKDKIIQMDDNRNYYVLEDTEYKGKKYILALECNLDNDIINEDDYFVMELDVNGENLYIKHVEDDEIAKMVIELLLDEVRKGVKDFDEIEEGAEK